MSSRNGPTWRHRSPPGRFDLDHIGAEVAEQFAAELTRFVGKLQDSQACQRARQGPDICHWSMSSM